MQSRRRALAAVAVAAAFVSSCQQIKDTTRLVGEKAGEAGAYVSTQFNAATTAIGQWASGRPDDDQTACYATRRVAFYDAVAGVKSAESLVFGAKLAGLVGATVTTYSTSFESRLMAAGFAVTMAALLKEIEADRTRIERVTATFDDLLACRRGEAKSIAAEVHAKRLSRTAGQEQLDHLKSLIEEDLVVARETNQTLQARTTEFQLSSEKAGQEVRQPIRSREQTGEEAPSADEVRQREQEVRKTQAALQTNQSALSQQSATIEQASELQQSDEFELSLLEIRYRPEKPQTAV